MAFGTTRFDSQFWLNARFQRWLAQAIFLALLMAFGYYLVDKAQDLDLSFDYLNGPAGFDIGMQFGTDFGRADSRLEIYYAGVINTIRLAAVGILLASLLGLGAGVARLSGNWLLSKIAMVYVETIRNTPLLVQITIWYLAVFLQLPKIADGFSFPPDSLDFLGLSIPFISADYAFLSVRGLALPWATAVDGFGIWLVILVGGGIAAVLARIWRQRKQDETGRPSYPYWWMFGTFGVIAVAGFLIAGLPLEPNNPEVGRFAYDGGLLVTPNFAAVLVALVAYTGAFIAEIVRGSIQAVPKGQTEASAALGLNAFQRLNFVILPQALRIMIPPLTSQYLNLTKNSSLAIAIAFPELVGVSRTIINNTGQAVPMFAIIMATYLTLSLIISLVMNTLHSRFTLGAH